MTDNDKALEIANNCCSHICLECNGESYFTSEHDCYNAAMEMAKWKEEEVIGRVMEWMADHRNGHRFLWSDIEDFEKEIKEY